MPIFKYVLFEKLVFLIYVPVIKVSARLLTARKMVRSPSKMGIEVTIFHRPGQRYFSPNPKIGIRPHSYYGNILIYDIRDSNVLSIPSEYRSVYYICLIVVFRHPQ